MPNWMPLRDSLSSPLHTSCAITVAGTIENSSLSPGKKFPTNHSPISSVAYFRYQHVGPATDEDGILPDAQEKGCVEKLLEPWTYCHPRPIKIVHRMPENHWRQIAETACKHWLHTIENDVFGLVAEDRQYAIHRYIFVADVQAKFQLEALARVAFWARDAAEVTAATLRDELGFGITASDDVTHALASADIAVTTTPSATPLILEDWLQLGQHVIVMGSDQKHEAELGPRYLAKTTQYVSDSQSQCSIKGELCSAIEPDDFTANRSLSELGDNTLGKTPRREFCREFIIVYLKGTGVQDIAIATFARRRAEAACRGANVTS